MNNLFALLFCLSVCSFSFAQGGAEHSLSEPLVGDNFQNFFPSGLVSSNINDLSSRGLTRGTVNAPLWSGPYWPVHQGILGARFGDRSFPQSRSFIDNFNSFQANPSDIYVQAGALNKLSPSEKYDLLIGDSNWTLTRIMWQPGKSIYDRYKYVPTWTGLCHGWAAAVSMGIKEPQHSVVVTDVTGKYKIEFYPDDIEALETYLWAQAILPTTVIGHRCEENPIVIDPYGRPMNEACLDSNPMTWHIVITNKIGVLKNSFIMDSSPGSEVWNYPVSGYNYSYFNPRTLESSHSLQASVEPIQNLTADKFKSHRSQKTRYVVGIMMDVFHPALVRPQVGPSNGRVTHAESFIYDLELDENYNIVGGEWYKENVRPDFLWTFPLGMKPVVYEDSGLPDTWDNTSSLPDLFAAKAKLASQRGSILSKIANALLQQSL